jgi:putative endonuclease
LASASASGGRFLYNMYYAYVLKSNKKKTFYYGSTSDLEQRLFEHKSGKNQYTRSRTPWKLVYFEEFTTNPEAVQRERFFKSGQGRQYIKEKLKDILVGA